MAKTMITQDLKTQWAEIGHALFIDAFSSLSAVDKNSFVFHGGTSLKFNWQSPRHSEDLDFLLKTGLAEKLSMSMPYVEEAMRRTLKKTNPDLEISIRDKTKDNARLLNYLIVISSPKIQGNTKVKVEFWQVEGEYIDAYNAKRTVPRFSGNMATMISQPLAVATLESAYADKITATATRPHLKWRDIFDLWWIKRQIKKEPEEFAEMFLKYVTAYEPVDSLSPDEALYKFANQDRTKIIETADPDIKKWLPPDLWNKLKGDGVELIVDSVLEDVKKVANEVRRILNERKENFGP